MKFIILLILLPISLASQTIKSIISEVNLDSLIHNVEVLAHEKPTNYSAIIRDRFSYSGRNVASYYLLERLNEYVLEASLDDYSEIGRNVIGYQEGVVYPDSILIICAHYDSVTDYCADDNASGTSAVIEAARILSKYYFEYSIIYAFWDEEELGLIGSREYAQRAVIENKKIVGVLNLDMIGYDGDEDGLLEVHVNKSPESIRLFDKLEETYNSNNFELELFRVDTVSFNSDHYSFLKVGFGALFISEADQNNDFNPDYHTSDDRLDLFNYDYFYNISALTVATLANLAVIIDPKTLDNNVHIYPVPFTDELTIKIKNGDPIGNVRLYDISSKLIEEFNTDKSRIVMQPKLNAGLYFYEITSENGEKSFIKVVKQPN